MAVSDMLKRRPHLPTVGAMLVILLVVLIAYHLMFHARKGNE